jgi:molybdopterin molybdotransferase
MLSYIEAQHIIKSFAHSFGTEKVLLDDALGRVIAEDVFADRDYPPFNRSAMDGYAIKAEDLQNGVNVFQIIDNIYAGGTAQKILSPGECYKIMTGAAVPLSANAVIRKEDAEQQDQSVSFLIDEIKPLQNIARRGEDLKKDDLVLNKSVRGNAAISGLLASVGKQEILVESLPTVAIITTGNEVIQLGKEVTEVQIRNSNYYVLKALLKAWSISPSYHHHVLDDPKEIFSCLEKALQYDIVIVNGGVSAGDADYVPSVLKQLAVEQLFHKVAIRPGKPFWCGHKEKTMVFALPGNPLSCLVTFTLFIRHYFESCFGLSSSLLSLPIEKERKQRVKLDEFFPVQIKGEPSQFHPVSFNGSGDIRLAFDANAFAIHLSGKTELKKGEIIKSYPCWL